MFWVITQKNLMKLLSETSELHNIKKLLSFKASELQVVETSSWNRWFDVTVVPASESLSSPGLRGSHLDSQNF